MEGDRGREEGRRKGRMEEEKREEGKEDGVVRKLKSEGREGTEG